jgi:hypothetical protein
MLPPHQAEFLRHLQNDQAFREHGRRITEQEFLAKVGIQSTLGASPIRNMKEGQIRALVNSQAGQTTERFFKAVQCIRYTWWERLSILRAKPLFRAVTEKFDYSRLLDNTLLNAVLSTFERERGGGGRYRHEVSHNNFADAMALLMLLELAKRYRAGSSTKVPRFFDPTGLFLAVANSAGILPELMITDGAYTTSVVVRSDYFIHKATFQTNTDQAQALYEDLKGVLAGTEDPPVA